VPVLKSTREDDETATETGLCVTHSLDGQVHFKHLENLADEADAADGAKADLLYASEHQAGATGSSPSHSRTSSEDDRRLESKTPVESEQAKALLCPAAQSDRDLERVIEEAEWIKKDYGG
jgi:hypothetical protein